MVSPRHSWSAPPVTAARATSTVRATGVRPSNGQSQAVAMMTSRLPPAPCASPAISGTAATASAVLRPALARLCPSEAETTYSRCAIPASTARTAPRGLATRADQCRSEEHTSELQSRQYLVCRLLLEKKKKKMYIGYNKQQSIA